MVTWIVTYEFYIKPNSRGWKTTIFFSIVHQYNFFISRWGEFSIVKAETLTFSLRFMCNKAAFQLTHIFRLQVRLPIRYFLGYCPSVHYLTQYQYAPILTIYWQGRNWGYRECKAWQDGQKRRYLQRNMLFQSRIASENMPGWDTWS